MPTLDGRTICALVKRHMKALPIVLFSSLSPEELKALVAAVWRRRVHHQERRLPRIAATRRFAASRFPEGGAAGGTARTVAPP